MFQTPEAPYLSNPIAQISWFVKYYEDQTKIPECQRYMLWGYLYIGVWYMCIGGLVLRSAYKYRRMAAGPKGQGITKRAILPLI